MEKLYYTISEVSEILDVPDYVIRFWESEIPKLAPKKRRGGKRIYKNSEIDKLKKLKSLLYDDKYSIEQAKEIMFSKKSTKIEDSDSKLDNQEEEIPTLFDNTMFEDLSIKNSSKKVEKSSKKTKRTLLKEVLGEIDSLIIYFENLGNNEK